MSERMDVSQTRDQRITETLETNYLPYAMSCIVSRALPEIDGLKPSHRKLLYTMYKMGLLKGNRTKSANVVGQTMRLNPHGDAAIYETMVRLARGNETLLHPLVDSKGNFGKVYSRDMAYAAARYTEVKLEGICEEFFDSIDEDTVDFVDNYDSTMQEPTLLPVSFPNVLVNPNLGIAVAMASNICSFNLREVCETTIEYIKNPDHDIASTLLAPDFSTGAELLYDKKALDEIYRTGRGSVKLRAKWSYSKKDGCIEITEIPYTTTIEQIIDKVVTLVKTGKIREITNIRDESDLSGLKLTIDVKRGTEVDKLMARLNKLTPLTDSYSCNFNILIEGRPYTMGISDILDEWVSWRTECIRRMLYYKVQKMKERLHLLEGLSKILLDIDRAIAIIRNTEEDSEVVPNLMIGFGIDEIQANYIADIKLRNINKEYILKRLDETGKLREEIADMEDAIGSRRRVRAMIIEDLKRVSKKYGKERKTEIVYEDTQEYVEEAEEIPDYPVTYFLTRGGYFKKITPQSLRMSGEHKLKEGDELAVTFEGSNRDELLIFTDKAQVYKTRGSDFEDTKASVLGDYLPTKLGMDEGESVFTMIPAGDYSGFLIFAYENGKVAKIEKKGYDTKTNRKKLINAYCDKSKLVGAFSIAADEEFVLFTDSERAILFSSALITPKAAKNAQGMQVITLKAKHFVRSAARVASSGIIAQSRFRVRKIPAAGALIRPEDMGQVQLTLA
ncbi:MAG: topoisomerase IV [Clostridia bacterium]|nr:topoisomerase IV [Clostridia bacterium]